MTPEMCVSAPEAEAKQAKRKGVAIVASATTLIWGAAALSFSRGPIGDIGVVIFSAGMLAPVAIIGGRAIKEALNSKRKV